MHLFRHSLLLLGVLLLAPIRDIAQTSQQVQHPVSVAFIYQSQRSNTVGGNTFWLQGGAGEISAELYRGFGIAMNIAGMHVNNINNSGVDQTSITMTFGPRYTWRPRSDRLSLFGQGLIGDSRGWNSVFPSTGGATSTYDASVLQVGGGIDVKLSRRIALRPLEANWLRTSYTNSTTKVQNNLRLGTGIVLRLQ
jgi:hypothetical protein